MIFDDKGGRRVQTPPNKHDISNEQPITRQRNTSAYSNGFYFIVLSGHWDDFIITLLFIAWHRQKKLAISNVLDLFLYYLYSQKQMKMFRKQLIVMSSSYFYCFYNIFYIFYTYWVKLVSKQNRCEQHLWEIGQYKQTGKFLDYVWAKLFLIYPQKTTFKEPKV